MCKLFVKKLGIKLSKTCPLLPHTLGLYFLQYFYFKYFKSVAQYFLKYSDCWSFLLKILVNDLKINFYFVEKSVEENDYEY